MDTSSKHGPSIWIVAALARELSKIRVADFSEVALVQTGEGVANVERGLNLLLDMEGARAIVSIGFAAALSGSLQPGDLVIAQHVHEVDARPDPLLLAAAREVVMDGRAPFWGVAMTSDEIVWQAESKLALSRALEENEIGFVDMESVGIARVCARHGVPFLIARSITDLLNEDLPLNFNLYRRRNGTLRNNRIFMAALRRPRALKGLMELYGRSELCATRMTDFVHRLLFKINIAHHNTPPFS